MGQADSTRALPAVTVSDARFDQTGYTGWQADSLPLSGTGTLVERLGWSNPVAVRMNAPGTLATVSARGAGAARTPVFWQGLNLQSPMNGVVDLSLVPLWPGDAVQVRYGGQSAAQSAGAMGGSVLISPGCFDPKKRGWSTDLGVHGGSFGRFEGNAAMSYRQAEHGAAWRFAWQQANNNFPFHNTALIGAPLVKQVNNYGERLDFQQFNRLKINDKNYLETALWLQRAFREIPPSMTEAPAQSWQRDRSLRAVATWSRASGAHSLWQHRLAWQEEGLAFHLAGDTDTSRSRTLLASTEFSRVLGARWVLKAGATAWYQQGQADGYADSTRWFRQNRLSGLAMAQYRWRGGQISAMLRQEWTNDRFAPFTWSLGGQHALSGALVFKWHGSRNFNLPTFNDRYWNGLGNPGLLPEKGYSADAGVVWRTRQLTLEGNAFYLFLDNWILWQPGANGLFRPGNLRRVVSRGVQLILAYRPPFFKGNMRFQGQYQLTRAENTRAYQGSSGVLHRQLSYTPQHAASITVQWRSKNWSAAYLHQFTGVRFNSVYVSSLPAFQLGNLLFRYTFGTAVHRFSLEGRVENCWNAAYQIIEYRPLPGRAWYAGVQWAF